MSDVLSRERIAEIVIFNEDLDITNFVAHKTIDDLLRERDVLLDIIRVQLESSGDCRCMGCQHGREALTKTGRLT